MILYRLTHFAVMRCERCGLMFRDPFPTNEELRAMYDDPAYHASAYFRSQLDPARTALGPEIIMQEDALNWLGRHTAARSEAGRCLLDVGCGTGVFLQRAASRGWRAMGVELSTALSSHAKRELGLDVRQGDFLAVELPSSAYEVITMWDFFEHVTSPADVLNRARDLLMPRGFLVVFTIDASSLFNSLGRLCYRLSAGAVTRPLELLYDARHNFYFTGRSLEMVLAMSGFEIVHRGAFRAHLGHWLSNPAPLAIRAAGHVIDLLSVLVQRRYRQIVYCQKRPEKEQ